MVDQQRAGGRDKVLTIRGAFLLEIKRFENSTHHLYSSNTFRMSFRFPHIGCPAVKTTSPTVCAVWQWHSCLTHRGVTPLTNRAKLHLSTPNTRIASVSDHHSIFKMSGSSQSHDQWVEQLSSSMKKLGIPEPPSFPNSYPALNPVDIYRAHLVECLAPITGADPTVIYNALAWTQTLEKGDLILPAPALRIKGKKPDEIANSIVEQVKLSLLSMNPDGKLMLYSFQTRH